MSRFERFPLAARLEASRSAENEAMLSKRLLPLIDSVGLSPGTDAPPGLIERAYCEFVTTRVEILQVTAKPKEKPEPLNSKIGARKRSVPVFRVRRFNQRFEDINGCTLHSVAEQELLRARETCQRRDQPQYELVMAVQCLACFACLIGARFIQCATPFMSHQLKRSTKGLRPLEPRGKEVKIQGVSVRATRNPLKL